jgi:hypothetical protein
MERWEYVHHQVSIQSHLIFEICNSAGTMYSLVNGGNCLFEPEIAI